MTGLVKVLEVMGDLPSDDEPVDQLAHALQCAGRALAVVPADDELVVACLLHDVGRVPAVANAGAHLPHEVAGATWCRPRFGERVAWLVGAHVDAKRYLVTRQESYERDLSPASVASLAAQGGPLPRRETDSWARHPWAAEACQLRRWDEQAKTPGTPVPELAHLVEIAARVAAGMHR